MKKIRKIRGFNRRFRQLEQWKEANLLLRSDLLENYERDHIDIVVHPWCDISVTKSHIPEPKRKMRRKMLSALLDIYQSWEKQLQQLGIPYYLKIWLFEPRFSQSQVVCAVGNQIHFYEQTFEKADQHSMKLNPYLKSDSRLQKMN